MPGSCGFWIGRIPNPLSQTKKFRPFNLLRLLLGSGSAGVNGSKSKIQNPKSKIVSFLLGRIRTKDTHDGASVGAAGVEVRVGVEVEAGVVFEDEEAAGVEMRQG